MWKNRGYGREIPGIIVGLVFSGILFGIIYYLSSFSFSGAAFFGTSGAVAALFGYGLFAFLFSIVNRKRRYDAVVGISFLGAVVFMFVEYVLPFGGILVNLSTTTTGFLITVLYGIVVAAFIIAGYAVSKMTNLR